MSKETEIANFQENWRRTKEYVDNHGGSIDPTVLEGLAKKTTSHAILNHLHADGNDNDVPTSVMAESSTGERLCFDYAGAKLGFPMVYYWECTSFYDGMTATSESYAIGSTINVVLGESVIGYVIKSVSKHKVATESEPGIVEEKATNAATYAEQSANNTTNLPDFIDGASESIPAISGSLGSDNPEEGEPKTVHEKLNGLEKTAADAKTAAEGAKTAAEAIVIPTDYAKSGEYDQRLTDLATAVNNLPQVGEYNATLALIQAAIAAIKVGMVIVNRTATSGLTLESGTTSVWASAISSLSFDLLMPSNGTEAHYRLRFQVSGSSFQISSPVLEWGGDEPTWTDGKTYEMDIVSDGVNNYAIAREW